MLSESVVVCIGASNGAQNLIASAAQRARERGVKLTALHIRSGTTPSGDDCSVQENLDFARILGAEIVQRSAENPAQGILTYLQSQPPLMVFVGRSPLQVWRRWRTCDVSTFLSQHLSHIPVEKIDTVSNTHSGRLLAQGLEYSISLAGVLFLTGLLTLIRRVIAEADVMMAYLAAVVIVAYYFSRGPTLFAAIASVALFDFFFVSPFYTFAVDHEKYLISFAVMATIGFLFSTYSERLKQQLNETSLRETQLVELYRLARALAAAANNQEVFEITRFHVTTLIGGGMGIYRLHDNLLTALDVEDDGTQDKMFLATLNAACIQHIGSSRFQSGNYEVYSLAQEQTRTALILVIRPRHPVSEEQHHLLQTYLSLVNLAFTRTQLSEQAAQAQFQAESEQLRNAVLSAVSHDLRTPLATIMGLTSTLLDKDVGLDETVTLECLETIYDLSEQLSQKVTNLLQMSRNLRSKLTPRLELQNPEEFVGGTLGKLKHRLENHPVEIQLDDTLLVPMDLSLMEVVLVNLLDNAAKFSPNQSTIAIHGKSLGQRYTLQVMDQGIGLKNSLDPQLFEHFFRMDNPEIAGTGLGLAISKAIVEAHGGEISAHNNADRGAVFTIQIPLVNDQYGAEFYG